MEHKLIHTENYLLVVSDEEIKKGDYYKDTYKIWQWNDDCSLLGRKKIIAHLPINSPILEGVDLLPDLPIENVSHLAQEKYKNKKDSIFYLALTMGYEAGYNKAKETYKYTEKDMIDWFEWSLGMEVVEMICHNKTKEEIFKKYIKSLQQPKLPIAFECETYMKIGSDMNGRECWDGLEIKTTTNSQGQTVWIGTYKF